MLSGNALSGPKCVQGPTGDMYLQGTDTPLFSFYLVLQFLLSFIPYCLYQDFSRYWDGKSYGTILLLFLSAVRVFIVIIIIILIIIIIPHCFGFWFEANQATRMEPDGPWSVLKPPETHKHKNRHGLNKQSTPDLNIRTPPTGRLGACFVLLLFRVSFASVM